MRTMPRNYSFPAPAGERRVACDYCGMTWYRSQMVRDTAGRLACPDDMDGRDEVTLDKINSSASVGGGRRGSGFGGW